MTESRSSGSPEVNEISQYSVEADDRQNSASGDRSYSLPRAVRKAERQSLVERLGIVIPQCSGRAAKSRGLIRCPYCEQGIRPTRLGKHLQKAHSRVKQPAVRRSNKPAEREPIARIKIRMRCPQCGKRIKPSRIARHIRRGHPNFFERYPEYRVSVDHPRGKRIVIDRALLGSKIPAERMSLEWFMNSRPPTSRRTSRRRKLSARR
jgi:uncharacterized C2H2 Zn-finger protein